MYIFVSCCTLLQSLCLIEVPVLSNQGTTTNTKQLCFMGQLLDLLTILDAAGDPRTKSMQSPGVVSYVVSSYSHIMYNHISVVAVSIRTCQLGDYGRDVHNYELTILARRLQGHFTHYYSCRHFSA